MPQPIRTIVAGISSPAKSDPTLVAAAELARWTGAELHLVLAYTVPAVFTPPELGYAYPEWLLDQADVLRGQMETAARAVPGAASAVCHAVSGPAPLAILETAASVHADLIVVGAARAGQLGISFLGTTAQRVLRGAEVPVLVLRRPVHRPLHRLLLTTDLSELSAAVHERGLHTVEALFGNPEAVRSLLVVSFLIVPSPLPRASVDAAARSELAAFLGARRARSRPVEPVVRSGAPGEEIPAEADGWGADLLVVGTHARNWRERLLLGSAAEASLRDAPCNVLAIPPSALAIERAEAAAAPGVQQAPVRTAPELVSA